MFTVVLGCAGAGKTAWKRDNWDRLPDWYFDRDSFAGGVGDWDTEAATVMARRYIDEEIAKAIDARLDFGADAGPSRVESERHSATAPRAGAGQSGNPNPQRLAYRLRRRGRYRDAIQRGNHDVSKRRTREPVGNRPAEAPCRS